MPYRMPKIVLILELFKQASTTPIREELMTEVGPPD
jgi:hypothetical protein